MSVAAITLPGMSATVITGYDRRMARWEPDGRGRLEEAALALYGERGKGIAGAQQLPDARSVGQVHRRNRICDVGARESAP